MKQERWSEKKSVAAYTLDGFRKQHSTQQALVLVCDKLYQALDRGEYAIGAFPRFF